MMKIQTRYQKIKWSFIQRTIKHRTLNPQLKKTNLLKDIY